VKYRNLFFAALLIILGGVCAGIFAVNKLGGWRYTAHRLYTLEAWPTYTQRLSQLELLPIDSGKVVFLGDSHIAFGEWHEWIPSSAVINRGIPGEGIQGLRAFAKTLNLSKVKLIVVQIGTNDLLFHDPKVVIERYKALVDQLGRLAIPIVYCTLPGVNNEVRWTGIESTDIETVNVFVRSLARNNQIIMDLSEALGGSLGVLPKGLTDDGVHLRGEGYQVWKQGLLHHINRVDNQ